MRLGGRRLSEQGRVGAGTGKVAMRGLKAAFGRPGALCAVFAHRASGSRRLRAREACLPSVGPGLVA